MLTIQEIIAITIKDEMERTRDNLKFVLQCINWDDLTQSDLERVKALCVENCLMDKDANWFQ